MKSGNLNFLEPSGPPQACNLTALPLHTDTANMIPNKQTNKQTTSVFRITWPNSRSCFSQYGEFLEFSCNKISVKVERLFVFLSGEKPLRIIPGKTSSTFPLDWCYFRRFCSNLLQSTIYSLWFTRNIEKLASR
jgi:hypothetical protein